MCVIVKTRCCSSLLIIHNQNFKRNQDKTEAIARRSSVKKVFINILQNSQENTCARVSFLKRKRKLKKRDPGTGGFL